MSGGVQLRTTIKLRTLVFEVVANSPWCRVLHGALLVLRVRVRGQACQKACFDNVFYKRGNAQSWQNNSFDERELWSDPTCLIRRSESKRSIAPSLLEADDISLAEPGGLQRLKPNVTAAQGVSGHECRYACHYSRRYERRDPLLILPQDKYFHRAFWKRAPKVLGDDRIVIEVESGTLRGELT